MILLREFPKIWAGRIRSDIYKSGAKLDPGKNREINEKLLVCFVDFSKAFGQVNRHISFHRLFTSGLHERVIETLHNMYQNSYFRLNIQENLNPWVFDSRGRGGGG